MKPTTLEWIGKAEDDWNVAGMSYRARKHPSYDASVFHAQQCTEKYLKARLEEASIAFSRTHDLRGRKLSFSRPPHRGRFLSTRSYSPNWHRLLRHHLISMIGSIRQSLSASRSLTQRLG